MTKQTEDNKVLYRLYINNSVGPLYEMDTFDDVTSYIDNAYDDEQIEVEELVWNRYEDYCNYKMADSWTFMMTVFGKVSHR